MDTQLEQLSQERLVEAQLQQLKDRQPEIPLLNEGNPHPAELVPPVPEQQEPARKRPASRNPMADLPPIGPAVPAGESQDLDLEKLKRLMGN